MSTMIMRLRQRKLLFLLCFIHTIMSFTFLFGRGLDNGDCTQYYYNDTDGDKLVVKQQREHLKNLIKKEWRSRRLLKYYY